MGRDRGEVEHAAQSRTAGVARPIVSFCAPRRVRAGPSACGGGVGHLSHPGAILYLAPIVEDALSEAFFHANFPHTHALLAARMRIEARKKAFIGVKDEIHSPSAPPMKRSGSENQTLRKIAPGHRSAGYVNS